MQLEQTLEMYQPRISEQRQATYFVVGDLESLSASALYTGNLPPMGPGGFGVLPPAGGGFGDDGGGRRPKGSKPLSFLKPIEFPTIEPIKLASIGTYSDFKPASDFGIGPGVAKKTEFNFIERYLPPHEDETHGKHLNLGSYLPGKKKPFLNLHIDLNDDD